MWKVLTSKLLHFQFWLYRKKNIYSFDDKIFDKIRNISYLKNSNSSNKHIKTHISHIIQVSLKIIYFLLFSKSIHFLNYLCLCWFKTMKVSMELPISWLQSEKKYMYFTIKFERHTVDTMLTAPNCKIFIFKKWCLWSSLKNKGNRCLAML